jgi:ferredoxin-NADP reductase
MPGSERQHDVTFIHARRQTATIQQQQQQKQQPQVHTSVLFVSRKTSTGGRAALAEAAATAMDQMDVLRPPPASAAGVTSVHLLLWRLELLAIWKGHGHGVL